MYCCFPCTLHGNTHDLALGYSNQLAQIKSFYEPWAGHSIFLYFVFGISFAAPSVTSF